MGGLACQFEDLGQYFGSSHPAGTISTANHITHMNNLNINESKLNEFMGKALGDMGAAINTGLVLIGDRLGLYKAMAGAGAMTSAELAAKTGTHERYVREWLCAQAAGGYVTYDSTTQKFTLPDEQAMALAVEDSPA